MIGRWFLRSLWLACLASPLAPAIATAAEPFAFGSPSAVTRGDQLIGRVVETRDGEELGRVHDFALDLASGRVAYVVVSVGSFLIEDSLIAVATDALRASADADGRLVLEADAASLRNAERFSARGPWPVQADVLAATDDRQPAAPEESDTGETAARPPQRGTATISDGERTATLSANERGIRIERRQPPQATEPAAGAGQRPAPTTPFERLDRDGDGVLNRAEIAHELTRTDSYSDIDLDGSGAIDAGEFDALQESRSESGDDASLP